MAEQLDEAFREIVRDITNDAKKYSKEDRKTVAGWLQHVGKEVQTDEDRRARNEYGRYLRYVVQSGEDITEDVRPSCARDFPRSRTGGAAFTSRGPCPRKDEIAKLQPQTDIDGIREVVAQVEDGEITTTAEFVYSLTNYVSDNGATFREIMEKDLNFFREIVDDTIDRRVQDEADVMMHTQNDIKQKFQSLTDAMNHRTMRIRQRLLEISPKFDWAANGKNRAKIAKLVTVKKKNESTEDPNSIDKPIHQVYMRGQWLKKELHRLQEENANLQTFLNKFRVLAAERKAQASHVPRMLCKEKKMLERELKCLQRRYTKNLEVEDALYVEHHRCVKPPSETTADDGTD